jgi:hypothetical protein
VLIEADAFNYPIENLVCDVAFSDRELADRERNKVASDIVRFLLDLGFIRVVAAKYRPMGMGSQEDDIYEYESERALSENETEELLNSYDKWEEMDVFSLTHRYEMAITDKGRKYLEEVIRMVN